MKTIYYIIHAHWCIYQKGKTIKIAVEISKFNAEQQLLNNKFSHLATTETDT